MEVIPLMLRIFSTLLNALVGSFVFNLITRSNRPVTGVMDVTLFIFLSWLIVRVRSPLVFAKTKLVDSDLDIFLLKSPAHSEAIFQRLNRVSRSLVTLVLGNLRRQG